LCARKSLVYHRLMPASVEVHNTPDALGEVLASAVLAAVQDAPAHQPVLLGCPGGRSLSPTYQAIGRQAARDSCDLSRLIVVMMDEYLSERDGTLVHCSPRAHYSCARFGLEQIRGAFNKDLPPVRQLPAESVWLPDPADPESYERRIAAAGGISLFLLASGASDGHVAFNPPGTPRNSRTRVIPLADTTRKDNLRTFPDFGSLDEVPLHGVSIGIATIAQLSRSAILVITGAHKRFAARRVTAVQNYDPDWPSTIIHECAGGRILLDQEAAGGITVQ